MPRKKNTLERVYVFTSPRGAYMVVYDSVVAQAVAKTLGVTALSALTLYGQVPCIRGRSLKAQAVALEYVRKSKES